MVNYSANRERINVNSLGSLYIDKNIPKDSRIIVYIGGQMEHRLHVLENFTGITFDPGHGLFNGSFMYEYSTRGNKTDKNAINFANTLIKCLEAKGLNEVDIITESYGGLIAACASKSPIIHKVVAIHPPILGTPLASKNIILENLDRLSKNQQRIAKLATMVVDDLYGFQKDNSLGIINTDSLRNIDLSKLTVIGSQLDRENDKNKLACTLYDIIYNITGEQSDGVVIYNEEALRKYGINYYTESDLTNHFDAGSKENIQAHAEKFLGSDAFKTQQSGSIEVVKRRILRR